MATRTLYAAIIGINDYKLKPLNGCIKDATGIGAFLDDWCKQHNAAQTNSANPMPLLQFESLYLLAPTALDKEIYTAKHDGKLLDDLKYIYPTFDAITKKAFEHLKKAKDGDICVFYYSGHGSTIAAPEQFWGAKSERVNETLVCIDSRSSARDLIDKEIAYLLYDALNGKKVHCLVIMDCCHAGDNTKGMDTEVLTRDIDGSGKSVPFEEYLGAKQGFYLDVEENGVTRKRPQIASYVHLAAARDTEESLDTASGGLFTSQLIESLKSGGSGKTYRELIQGLNISVRNRRSIQNPQAFALNDRSLDQAFLGGEIKPYRPSYELRFDHVKKDWILYGGSVDGITASNQNSFTQVQVEENGAISNVLKVFNTTAILDAASLQELDKAKPYKALIIRRSDPSIRVGISAGLRGSPGRLADLKDAFQREAFPFTHIDFDGSDAVYDYLIRITDRNEYLLARAGSELPVFKRETDAASFLRNVDAVGKWIMASELKAAGQAYQLEDFIFSMEMLEGKDLFAALQQGNIDALEGKKTQGKLPEEVTLKYSDGKQPAFRLSVQIAPESRLESCYIGALYLENNFGISHDLIRTDEMRLLKGGDPVYLRLNLKSNVATRYNTIPVYVNPILNEKYGINEVLEYLKIYAASEPLDLQRFQQDGLAFDENPNGKSKALGLEPANDQDPVACSIFTTRVHIVRAAKERTLAPNQENTLWNLNIQTPPGFSARAFIATNEDLRQKIPSDITRGDAADLNSMISLPPGIFGDALTAESAFPAGFDAGVDNSVQVLELLPVDGGTFPVLAEGQELVIKPQFAPPQTRSAEVEEEWEDVIIPLGYDQQSDLHFPLGYSDNEGNVHINVLPPPSDGLVHGDGEVTRGGPNSIKLFFRKIFRRKQMDLVNILRLYSTSDWKDYGDKPETMEAVLRTKANGRVILMVHGYTANTKHMLECFKAEPVLQSSADFVLTYDYESLATNIVKSGQLLFESLKKAGFGKPGMPELILVSHSMGGLVSRCLLEKWQGSAFIKRIVMLGTPNGGTNVATFGKAVLGMIAHAINVTGPVKFALTGLSFLLKKLELDPVETLKEQKPDSDLIRSMLLSPMAPEVEYFIIAGDTDKLDPLHSDNKFLKRLAQAAAYPIFSNFIHKERPNDLVVTHSSMQSLINWNVSHLKVVASDHLSYFRERLCTEELAAFINGGGTTGAAPQA